MTIVQAKWSDILTVLHETDKIWSPGLTRDVYHDYIWRQINHTWARRNYRFLVLKHNSQVVASCKLYTVTLSSRGKSYLFGGIGAIYTQLQHRNRGHATALIEAVIELCENQRYQGMILFSDIGPAFYTKFGFMQFGDAEFSISAIERRTGNHVEQADIRFVRADHVSTIVGIYNKWQRTQPFAFQRSELYMDYKLERERFLAKHSYLCWPSLEITLATENGIHTAYALTERGGTNLRILELVGSESARLQLWSKLFDDARRNGIYRVRGWESVAADLFPGFHLHQIVTPQDVAANFGPVHYNERDWGTPMFLPFDEDLEDWLRYFPCPLLELDHL